MPINVFNFNVLYWNVITNTPLVLMELSAPLAHRHRTVISYRAHRRDSLILQAHSHLWTGLTSGNGSTSHRYAGAVYVWIIHTVQKLTYRQSMCTHYMINSTNMWISVPPIAYPTCTRYTSVSTGFLSKLTWIRLLSNNSYTVLARYICAPWTMGRSILER